MLDPDGLYELAGDLPEVARPVLIQALTGFVDAGNATRLAREHLTSVFDSREIATFDVDQLIDYRSRRPPMIFVRDRWEHFEQPTLRLSLLHDPTGQPFLLLSGPEPDLQWERFVRAVTDLIERFDVRLTVGLNAIPMAVPHTRPIGLTAHATRKELVAGYEPWLQRVQVPGNVSALLEYRLGQLEHDAMGFAVHVPHYLAQAEYPAAAETMLTAAARASGLELPIDDLRASGELVNAEINRQVTQSDEAAALVRSLEQQYDSVAADRRASAATGGPVLPTGPLPTADELAAELERFLADQQHPGDQPSP